MNNPNMIKTARNILETSINAVDASPSDYTLTELKELMAEILDNTEVDYCLELDGFGEVRLIHSDDMAEIWTESLLEQIKDCYELDKIPAFVSIDWEQTVENCKIDGMGHHFSSYDGNEYSSGDWYIFRTN
jgi:hypothetical protein